MLSQSEWKRPFASVFATSVRLLVDSGRTRDEVVVARLGEVVVVDEVVAGVVGRVDVDELDLAEVRLLEQLQRLEVVALDEEVLGGVEVDRSSRTGRSVLAIGALAANAAARLPGQSSW